jgi:hypothetical protein
MNSKIFFAGGCLLLIALTGCNREKKIAAHGKLDACDLLTNEEIGAVQGSPIKDKKGSEQANGLIRTSQCYFGAEQSNRSVSLAITQPNAPSSEPKAARSAWEQSFGEYEGAGKEREDEKEKEKKESLKKQKGEEEEHEGAPPKKIEGIGEEAFWAGSRVGGALYVLKGDLYIRISLGGPDAEEARIEKSKELVKKALGRL